MGKFSPVFPMTWTLFKGAWRRHRSFLEAESAEKSRSLSVEGQEPKKRKRGFTRETSEKPITLGDNIK